VANHRTRAPLGLLCVASVFLAGCGSLNLARTLGRGHSEVSGSVGGPVVRVADAVTPLPLMRVAVRHGVTNDLDLMGHLSLELAPR